MFRKNLQHLQMFMFSGINSLPEKQLKRLEESWAGTFYRGFFLLIDEVIFAVLYSDDPSRPNIPVNILFGLEVLKAGFGWSDEEMYNAFCFNVQVRYALGCWDLGVGHFELRTMYNFRQRLTRHMQETGENLIEKAFEQVTDQQIDAFELKTGKLRMDSTLVMSNIREMSRLQLMVEVLQRVHRMLSQADQQHYAHDFEPYLRGSSGQYIYHIKGEKGAEHIERIGQLMQRLVQELSVNYGNDPNYQMLQRVFEEHFVVEEAALRAKVGKELCASSLQSPDDWEASYRRKQGQAHKGYAANLTETCDPDNDLQLIVKVQVEPNNTDDAAMLEEALPELKVRTDVDEMYTDGGYNSPSVDATMREHKVELIQTAIRGRKPSQERLGLDDFAWEINTNGQPVRVTCPHGQQAEVGTGRKNNRYGAAFEAPGCENCPRCDQCPTKPLKRKPQRVLRFSQQKLDVARRRQRQAKVRASGRNLRAAVEATVRSVKHPFGNGKVPVRGKPRVSMIIVGSAAMSNVRRIHRYRTGHNKATNETTRVEKGSGSAGQRSIVSLFAPLLAQVRGMISFQPALVHGL